MQQTFTEKCCSISKLTFSECFWQRFSCFSAVGAVCDINRTEVFIVFTQFLQHADLTDRELIKFLLSFSDSLSNTDVFHVYFHEQQEYFKIHISVFKMSTYKQWSVSLFLLFVLFSKE